MKPASAVAPLLTVAEAASLLRVSPRTIRAMIADGRLRAIRPRGLDIVRIPERALVALLGREALVEIGPTTPGPGRSTSPERVVESPSEIADSS